MSLNSKQFAQFYSGPHLYRSYLMQPLQFLCVGQQSRSAARSRLLVCRSAPVARGSSAALAGRPPLISRSSARGSRPGPLIRRSSAARRSRRSPAARPSPLARGPRSGRSRRSRRSPAPLARRSWLLLAQLVRGSLLGSSAALSLSQALPLPSLLRASRSWILSEPGFLPLV